MSLLAIAVVTIAWTNPTQFDDGSALAASQITQTRIEHGTCVGTAFGAKQGEFAVIGPATTATSPDLAPGTHCFRAYTSAAGAESAATNAVQKSIPQPAARTTIAAFDRADFAPVWGITFAGARSTVLAGLVPKGTPCSGTFAYSYQSHQYFEIDRALVMRKLGAGLPARVAAPCVAGP